MMVDPATHDSRSEEICAANQHQNTIYHAKKKIVHAILINKKTTFLPHHSTVTCPREGGEKGDKRDSTEENINDVSFSPLDTVSGGPDAGRGRGAPFTTLVWRGGPFVLVGRLLAEIQGLGRQSFSAVGVEQLVAVGRR